MERESGEASLAVELLSKEEIERKVIAELKVLVSESEKKAAAAQEVAPGISLERLPILISPDLSRVFIKDVLKSSTASKDISRWLSTKQAAFTVFQGHIFARGHFHHPSRSTRPESASDANKVAAEAGSSFKHAATPDGPATPRPKKKASKSKAKRNSKRQASTEVPVGYVLPNEAKTHSISIIKKYPHTV